MMTLMNILSHPGHKVLKEGNWKIMCDDDTTTNNNNNNKEKPCHG